MAEEQLQYTLTLATRAAGTGAKDTATDLERVAAAKARVDAGARDRSIQAFMDRTADSTRAAYGEVYILDSELSGLGKRMAATTQQSQTLTAGVTQLRGSTANASTALLMFSQGFEDAQYGMRGF